MNKTKLTFTLALSLGLTYSTAAPSITYAKQSLSSIHSAAVSQTSLQSQVASQQKQVQAELDKVNAKVLKLTGQIGNRQAEVNKTKDKVAALQDQIQVIQKRMDQRKDLLKDRLKSIYENGGSVDFLDVLVGSKDFGDFLDRMLALHEITQQDQSIINAQKRDQDAVKTKKQNVEQKLAYAQKKMSDLQAMLAEVQSLQSKKQVAAKALSNKQKNIGKKLAALKSAASTLAGEQSQTKTSGQASQNSSQPKAVVHHSAALASSSSSNHKSDGSSGSNSNQSSAPLLSASVATGGISGIINYGKQFIGHSKYVWGASNPSSGSFDCSGFVNAAFAANGISLGGNTDSLVHKGSAVSAGSLKPGDLVFFNTYKTNGHVGIYIGGGSFIGSQSSTGVAIANLSSGYWHDHFAGVARRILN